MRTTSSSISSSRGARAWRRFAATLVAVAGGVALALLAVAYAVDPYDSGRSPLFAKPGVRPQGPRTAAASRGRDPAFDAAIVGNSHVQLLSPERLAAKTGLSFVQLSVPGSGPREQLVLVDWFLRHRASARALVLGADLAWCTGDPGLAATNPFPYWLFSRSGLAYAGGLMRVDVLEELPRRLAYVFAAGAERARPDGYWDYEAEGPEAGRARFEASTTDDPPANASGRFPAADALRELAATLPPDLALVVVFPPQHAAALPRPGSKRAAADDACKAALRAALAGRPGAAVLDWRVDRPENRDPAHYLDLTHYRRPVAEAVEDEIAAALTAPNAASGRLRQNGPLGRLGAETSDASAIRKAFSPIPGP